MSDLRDVQLTMGCVPAPAGDSASAAGVSGGASSELRVGPLQFPSFPVGGSASPAPAAVAAATAAASVATPSAVTRGSMGAWDFSMPARAVPQESPAPRAVAASPPSPARRAGEMDAADLVRQLHPSEAASEDDEDLYDEDDEDAAAMRNKPKAYDPCLFVFIFFSRCIIRPKRKALPSSAKRKARGPKGMVENPVCGHCNTKNTPEWRSGPNGMLLCNACGLKWSRKRQKPGNP